MTGFGRAVATIANKKITIEIKSLNSKQLDLSVRLPTSYRQLEADMRALIAALVERGKVELNLQVENIGEDAGAVKLNIPALKAYKKQVEQMAEALQLPLPDDWYATLLRFPDAMHSDVADEVGEDEAAAILDCARQAAGALNDYRATEGRKLAEFFRTRISNISALLAQVPQYEVERMERIRGRITEGLASIPQVDYDKGRFEQEMIFYIEKLDIAEEKQRLAQHLEYFISTLDGKMGQGKKLGFIAQEMGREINTMGSKSNHAEMQILVVKMKDELEQIKEQVLNAL